MVPFTSPSLATRSSSAWLSTSTRALPMPTTSSSAGSATAPTLSRRLCWEMTVEQKPQALPELRWEGSRIGDDRVPERIGAAVRAGLGHEREDPPQHFLGGRHVLHEVGHDRLDGDRVVLLMPDVVVGHERERGVAELGF